LLGGEVSRALWCAHEEQGDAFVAVGNFLVPHLLNVDVLPLMEGTKGNIMCLVSAHLPGHTASFYSCCFTCVFVSLFASHIGSPFLTRNTFTFPLSYKIEKDKTYVAPIQPPLSSRYFTPFQLVSDHLLLIWASSPKSYG
jgi:hypothetical protein